MGLIVPGRNVVCTKSIQCQWCGVGRASEGSIYMCEGLNMGGPAHEAFCSTIGCDGAVILLKDKSCCYCACCFKPLDDGDTSLVQDEEEDDLSQDDTIQVRQKEPAL